MFKRVNEPTPELLEKRKRRAAASRKRRIARGETLFSQQEKQITQRHLSNRGDAS